MPTESMGNPPLGRSFDSRLVGMSSQARTVVPHALRTTEDDSSGMRAGIAARTQLKTWGTMGTVSRALALRERIIRSVDKVRRRRHRFGLDSVDVRRSSVSAELSE